MAQILQLFDYIYKNKVQTNQPNIMLFVHCVRSFLTLKWQQIDGPIYHTSKATKTSQVTGLDQSQFQKPSMTAYYVAHSASRGKLSEAPKRDVVYVCCVAAHAYVTM